MLTIFWDSKGPISKDFLKKGEYNQQCKVLSFVSKLPEACNSHQTPRITVKEGFAAAIGWSENNFFFEIEKSVVLKTCQTGKIYEKNWFWRVATFGGLATPQNVF